MLLTLVVLNLALAILAVAVPSGRRVRRERLSGQRVDSAGQASHLYLERSAAISETLLRTVADALDADPRIATTALVAVAADPVRFVAVLPTALSLLREVSSPVRLVAAHAVSAVLAARPELLPICWPDAASLARRVVVCSIHADDGLGAVAQATSGRLRRIIEQAVHDRDPGVRRDACARLSLLEHTVAVDLAAGAMSDPDEQVRRVACEVLGQLGDGGILEVLVERLATVDADRRPGLLAAVSAIGRRHLDALSQIARTAEAPAVRAAATEGLGATGLARAAAVAAALLHDQSKELRRAAAGAIADVARITDGRPLPPGIVDHLIRQVERERSSSAMLAILDAIEACHAIAALDGVLRALPSMNPAIRERAVEVMATVQHPHA